MLASGSALFQEDRGHSSEIYNSYNSVAFEIIAVNSPCPQTQDCSQQYSGTPL